VWRKKTEKGSTRIGCKGHLKAKLDKKGVIGTTILWT
jgi:hypothetical protein